MQSTTLRVATGLLLVICLGCRNREAGPDKAQPQPAPAAGTKSATVTATPNPVPAGNEMGTTRIVWETGSDWGQVFISQDGGADTTMFGEGARGAADAPWIQTGHTYEFRLYAGKDHSQLLDKVVVSRAK
jgi:hypothetical protein